MDKLATKIDLSVEGMTCAACTGRVERVLKAQPGVVDAVANLVTIHLKTGIGRLSAYCGAVSAGCGAAAGLAYLQGGDYDTVAHTVVNTVAMDSGIICDGAKASCAAKIAAAVDAGLLGLAYGGFSYTKDTTAVKLGPIELTVKEKQSVNIPLWAGVAAVVVLNQDSPLNQDSEDPPSLAKYIPQLKAMTPRMNTTKRILVT